MVINVQPISHCNWTDMPPTGKEKLYEVPSIILFIDCLHSGVSEGQKKEWLNESNEMLWFINRKTMSHPYAHLQNCLFVLNVFSESVFILGTNMMTKPLSSHGCLLSERKKTTFTYIWWLMVNYSRCVQITGRISWFPSIFILRGFDFSGRVIQTETGLAAKNKKKKNQIAVDRCSIGHPKRQSGRNFSRGL